MRISKSDVLRVIKHEVFAPGNFALLPPGRKLSETIESVPNVTHDIIGALARHYLPSTRTYKDLVQLCFTITKGKFMSPNPVRMAVDDQNPLGALSAHFENVTVYTDDVVDDEVRDELASFVNIYFPEVIEVQDA